MENKIVITTDGKTTLARLFNEKGEVKRAEAKCSPSDTFDFETGAKIALDRLIEKKAKETIRKAHVGEMVRLRGTGGYGEKHFDSDGVYKVEKESYGCAMLRSKKGQLLAFLPWEYVVLDQAEDKPAKKFVPHLISIGKDYGEIGKETKYVDAVGRKLCVGDVVEYFDGNGNCYGETVIVEQILSYRNNEVKQFVMGIEMCCDDKTGSISEGWKIIKKRSFEEVKNGEEVFGVKLVFGVKFVKEETSGNN